MTDAARHRAFDPEAMAPNDAYQLINAVVVPRPIGWVSTLSDQGVANIAPHSYFNVLSADPPTVFFSSSGVKDSLRNARFTGDFVVNVVSEELAEAMNLTSADFPPGESEFAAAGLTAVASDLVRAPRLLEAPASLECRVTQIIEVGRGPNHVVIGEVLRFHVAESVLVNGRVDASRFRPVGRLSGSGYVYSREFVQMPRPTYAGLVEAGTVRPAK
ncbi:MAG TPA: flavin reductase family protein [Dehalococcoidia bacterium]|nr:flavin reductase family protein [Dehalococcoidia bacterium]